MFLNSSFKRFISIAIILILRTAVLCGTEQNRANNVQKRFTLMGLGDSITQGGEGFESYLFPLWEKLFTAGYQFEFIGPNSTECRIGTLMNAGFRGKNAEFLDQCIDSIYRKYPADIVLLHTGHNHFDTEKPVAGIIAAQESIIKKIIAINPNVKILVAQVISSAKLPKYSYINELNENILLMVGRINNKNVILVNQAKDFDCTKYTINDQVHPNNAGAEKIAEVWFQSLKKMLSSSEQIFHPEIISYKKIGNVDLKLHIFKPEHLKQGEHYPVIVYFFGGGWRVGTPLQFYRECAYYASKGMIAISAEYRISFLHKTTPLESVEDARDVIKWLRKNAERLNIDPKRIAAAGASAGGQLAAVTGIITKDSSNISSKPNLLVLYYPVIDNGEGGFGPTDMKRRYQEISPLHNIDKSAPPTLFIVGTKDTAIPVKTAQEFYNRMNKNGVYCELHLLKGAGHPIFQYRNNLTKEYYTIQSITNKFLFKYGFLNK